MRNVGKNTAFEILEFIPGSGKEYPEDNKHGITRNKEYVLLVVLETEIYSIYVISFWIIAAFMILNHPQ